MSSLYLTDSNYNLSIDSYQEPNTNSEILSIQILSQYSSQSSAQPQKSFSYPSSTRGNNGIKKVPEPGNILGLAFIFLLLAVAVVIKSQRKKLT